MNNLPVELKIYLENQNQLNATKKLLSLLDTPLTCNGTSVCSTFAALLSCVVKGNVVLPTDTTIHKLQITKGILCALEFTLENSLATQVTINFPHCKSTIALINTQLLFSLSEEFKWSVITHEWANLRIHVLLEALEEQEESTPSRPEDFLPTPLYHLLLCLLREHPLPALQVGMVKAALLALRSGNESEIPYYNDAVLSNVCRDVLFPLTHAPTSSHARVPNERQQQNGTPLPNGHTTEKVRQKPPKNLRSVAVFKTLFHGPSGTGKSRVARFIFENCGMRGIFFGSPVQLNMRYNSSVDTFKQSMQEQVAIFSPVPSVFVLDEADFNIPPLGSLAFLHPILAKFPNLLFIAITSDVASVTDKSFFNSGRVTQVYFSRPYARYRAEILAHTFEAHGFMRAAATLRMPLVRSVENRIRRSTCGRSGLQLIATSEACVRRCALDDPTNTDPSFDFVLPRLEKSARDMLLFAENDTPDWSAVWEEIDPPEQWNQLMLAGNSSISGRVLCDVEEGKLTIEYCDGSVHPLWFPRGPRGPCIAQQLALGFSASLVDPSTVLVLDSRRQELISESEMSTGFAKLVASLQSAGSRGGALVVIDVDDLVGIAKDATSRVLLTRHTQDPIYKVDSTRLLRENLMHKIISFSSVASFVRDITDKNFCIVVAVTRDPFVRERLTSAWQTNLNFPIETTLIPKGICISQSSIALAQDDDDSSGCVCAKLEPVKNESYLWIVQVFITQGYVSLGVVHSSVNTLTGRFNSGIVGENPGSWGFRITPNCVEVCQVTSIPSKAILSPLPEAHENPTRNTLRNNRAIFGVFMQSTENGTHLHLLRFIHEQGATIQRGWDHVAFKRIDSLEGLNLMPAFGIAKRNSSINLLACHRVPSTWFPSDALPEVPYSPSFVASAHSSNSVTLFKGGFHLNATSVFLDKVRIPSGKKALLRFHLHDKTPSATPELTKMPSGMNMLLRMLPENSPRLIIGFIKEIDITNVTNLTCSNIFGFNPYLARCYYATEGEREVASLKENPQKTGYLYIDLSPNSPYCGSIHYFKIRVLGNLVYCGSLIEGLSIEPFRGAISFDDPNTEQGRSLGTLTTAKIGAGLSREYLPPYVPEWFPLDYSAPQGLLSFSPDPNTIRQEKDGMTSRFTKELAPANMDWHYIEARIYSCTGSSQVILGFVPSDDFAATVNTHVGAKGTSGFGYSVHSSDVFVGNSGVARANTRFGTPPKDYIRVGLLFSSKLGEAHLFWAEIGSPGPLDYKGLLFENIPDNSYRFAISTSHAGTTVSWRGFSCNGSLSQAKANVVNRILEFHELTGNVAYASRNYVMFPGMDIIGDDVTVIANATPKLLRGECDRLGAGAFTSSGVIKDYTKIYQRMRIVGNRVELSGLSGPVCSDFCLRVHIAGYVFLPQHDATGDETDAETADLLAVAQRCTSDTNALGFNTGGFIKYSLKNWVLYTTDPLAAGCFSGIFVKETYMCKWLGTMDAKKCLATVRTLVADSPIISSGVNFDWGIN